MSEHCNQPLITVLMAVYNGERYLQETLDSVFQQTYQHFELLVIDDGSTDTTLRILQSCQDERLRIIQNNINVGIVPSVNEGVKQAKGQYIARMDADDICYPGRLMSQLHYMRDNPHVDACFSWIDCIDSKGLSLPVWPADRANNSAEEIRRCLLTSNCLAQSTAFIKATCLKENLYLSGTKYWEDYELWLSLSLKGFIIEKIKSPLIQYRIHGSSISSSFRNSEFLAAKRRLFIFSLVFSRLRREKKFSLPLIKSLVLASVNLVKIGAKNNLKHLVFSTLFQLGHCVGRLSPNKLKGATRIFVTGGFDFGGAPQVHLDIMRVFEGEKIAIIATDRGADAWRHKFAQVGDIIDLRRFSHIKLFRPFLAGKLGSILNKVDDNAVIIGCNSAAFHRAVNLVRKDVFVANIFHAMGGGFEDLLRFSASRINTHIAISENVKRQLLLWDKQEKASLNIESKIQVINNCTDIPPHLPVKPQTPFTVFYVGRDSKEKRIHLFAQIAKSVVDSIGEGVRFHLVGVEKTTPNIEEEVKPYCQFHGKIDQKDVSEMLLTAHAVVIVSEREGFPLVFIEGMANGVIPISVDVGGVTDHINGENGVVLNDNVFDEEAIVKSMSQIVIDLAQGDIQASLQKNAHLYAQKMFSRAHFEDEYRKQLSYSP